LTTCAGNVGGAPGAHFVLGGNASLAEDIASGAI
jgi:hypothetical protein